MPSLAKTSVTFHQVERNDHVLAQPTVAGHANTLLCLPSEPTSTQAVQMSDSPPIPEWTDHNVSDPGVTLLQALVYTIGAVLVAAASVVVLRRRHRSKLTGAA